MVVSVIFYSATSYAPFLTTTTVGSFVGSPSADHLMLFAVRQLSSISVMDFFNASDISEMLISGVSFAFSAAAFIV